MTVGFGSSEGLSVSNAIDVANREAQRLHYGKLRIEYLSAHHSEACRYWFGSALSTDMSGSPVTLDFEISSEGAVKITPVKGGEDERVSSPKLSHADVLTICEQRGIRMSDVYEIRFFESEDLWSVNWKQKDRTCSLHVRDSVYDTNANDCSDLILFDSRQEEIRRRELAMEVVRRGDLLEVGDSIVAKQDNRSICVGRDRLEKISENGFAITAWLDLKSESNESTVARLFVENAQASYVDIVACSNVVMMRDSSARTISRGELPLILYRNMSKNSSIHVAMVFDHMKFTIFWNFYPLFTSSLSQNYSGKPDFEVVKRIELFCDNSELSLKDVRFYNRVLSYHEIMAILPYSRLAR